MSSKRGNTPTFRLPPWLGYVAAGAVGGLLASLVISASGAKQDSAVNATTGVDEPLSSQTAREVSAFAPMNHEKEPVSAEILPNFVDAPPEAARPIPVDAEIIAPPGEVAAPLVFDAQAVMPALSEFQLNKLRELQDDFARAIFDAGPDPYDPEYRKVWEKARAQSDRRFTALFGRAARQQAEIRRRLESTKSPK